MPEKPELEITEAKLVIDGKEIKHGDIITFVHNGLIVRQGRIKFGVYEDRIGDFNRWHLGYYVEWHDGSWTTLPEALCRAQEFEWSWYITKQIKVEENEARNNSS